MSARLDHLVVAAATLEQGVAWCEATLGLVPGPGGRHAHMGTHNRLLALGGEAFPQAYLEIIAIDPAAPAPGRPRWFALDDPAMQARLAQGPRLVHWVARPGEGATVHALRAGLQAQGLDPGEPLPAARDTPEGRLQWKTTVRADGALLLAGALPTLIEWDGPHPTARMAAPRLRLRGLALAGVPAPVQALLRAEGVVWTAGPGPALRVQLDAPLGPVTLDSGA